MDTVYTFVSVVLGITLLLGWFGMLFRGIWWWAEADDWRKGLPWFIAAVVMFASFATSLIVNTSVESYPNELCLSGHQEWKVTQTGKTMIRDKAWVCDRREAERGR